MYYREIIRHGVRGLWIVDDPIAEPDVIIYYAHGEFHLLVQLILV